MSRIENNEEYLNGEEVMAMWPASKNLFYSGIQPRLQAYHFEGKKRPHYYKKSEVLALRSGQPTVQKEPITLYGIVEDWTIYLRAHGYQANTTTEDIEIVALPKEVETTFHISSEKRFARRTRKTLANGIPICVWSTYYPLELVEGEILAKMRQESTLNVVKQIKEVHGIIVGFERDRYTARNATLEEQKTLQLLTNEPVLIIQRGCWTSDKQIILTHISHMTLLGSWFAIEHEIPVDTRVWKD
jgi:DNA-binding GntR family transcriptional regulator